MRRKKLIIFAFIISFFVFSNLTSAQPLEIEVNPKTASGRANTLITYDLTVRNNQGFSDFLTVSVIGLHLEWINLEKNYFEIGPHSNTSLKITFYPKNVAGNFNYKVKVTSTKDPSVFASETFYLNVLYPEEFVIKDFTAEKKDNLLNLNLQLQSGVKQTVNITFNIKDSEGKLIKFKNISAEVEGLKLIRETMNIPSNLLAGTYIVEANILEKNLTSTSSFEIEPIKNVTQSKEVTSTAFYKEIKIYVKNFGNVIEKNLTVVQDIPPNIITWIVQPTRCYNERKTCEWNIQELKPGETYEVSYRIEYWPNILGFLGIIVGIGFVVAFFVLIVSKPRIAKRYKKKGKGRYTIILEIKNSFFYKIKNAVVRDWVSPLAKVELEFEGVKPIIRKSEAGTELIWRLGEINPRGEIILSYRIKTLVQGELKMPKACIRYKTEKKKSGKVCSGKIIIK